MSVRRQWRSLIALERWNYHPKKCHAMLMPSMRNHWCQLAFSYDWCVPLSPRICGSMIITVAMSFKNPRPVSNSLMWFAYFNSDMPSFIEYNIITYSYAFLSPSHKFSKMPMWYSSRLFPRPLFASPRPFPFPWLAIWRWETDDLPSNEVVWRWSTVEWGRIAML